MPCAGGVWRCQKSDLGNNRFGVKRLYIPCFSREMAALFGIMACLPTATHTPLIRSAARNFANTPASWLPKPRGFATTNAVRGHRGHRPHIVLIGFRTLGVSHRCWHRAAVRPTTTPSWSLVAGGAELRAIQTARDRRGGLVSVLRDGECTGRGRSELETEVAAPVHAVDSPGGTEQRTT